jgi:hypothetical protein
VIDFAVAPGGGVAYEGNVSPSGESQVNGQALYSTVGGAGRVMSGTQGAGRVQRRKQVVNGRKSLGQGADQAQSRRLARGEGARVREQGIVVLDGRRR